MDDSCDMRFAVFRPGFARTVAGWVRSREELRWLAPSTPAPLTAAKVEAWRRVGGEAFVFSQLRSAHPLAYGELNRMRHDVGHLWMGHVIVDPVHRGKGIGLRFVKRLLMEAFIRREAGRVSLVVFPGNRAAVQCYLAAGFCCTGDEHHRFIPGGPLQRLLRFEIRNPAELRAMKTDLSRPMAVFSRG